MRWMICRRAADTARFGWREMDVERCGDMTEAVQVLDLYVREFPGYVFFIRETAP